ncbi:putative metalloprotease with PDZ domain [Oceanihabitans sediminis]|uniref:Peptidase M61 n=1 Tax=Oceanihabitans sediminis TaxID=1812012 RepID=A0A368P540_9FLAO|nr:peptidase M61 [Oceanihabitans sediminis]RBP32921.1 putative metalloprotease with PDZ domain [Oceanihabitans sediminis]RCU57556.1 peptidase M61 [Oceanihabitans sediminis]
MKRVFAIIGLSTMLVACGTSSKSAKAEALATSSAIETTLDLTKVVDDKVPVTVDPGRFITETVIYRLPRVVQGTYSVSDFGKYVDDFKAFDYDGNEIATTKLDVNSWSVSNATKLDKITYYVNDTFDVETSGGIGGEEPFSPAGTNIEPTNYVLNLHGFIGYFDSLKNAQYKLDVTAPASFVRSSAIQEVGTKTSDDGSAVTTSYFAPRYFDITDNPMFYGELDVEEFQVEDIKVVLSVYSPNNVHSAASLKETMYKMMQAQKRYLGDIDSTPRYDIFLYLSDGGPESPKGFGALEHHTSTVVVLPEDSSKPDLDKSMIDVVAHEFFHIVTPLSVHSDDVHYFDYHQPTFSKHLWMYEGVTEYFAQHFQVYEGLMSEDEFYASVLDKIRTAANLDDTMSFTVMSENVLDEPYASQYYNVYLKGALIGMCIDILMREESDGNRSMLSLMKELSTKYGKNKPFNDDTLIEEITAMTYPSIGEFLKTHVEGTTPIDYNKFFAKVGLGFIDGQVETNYIQNDGEFIFVPNMQTLEIAFSPAVVNNSFWNDNGVKPGDVLKSVDGVELNMNTAQQVISTMYVWQAGQEIHVVLDRNGEEVGIKTTLTPSFANGKKLQASPNATEAQNALRKVWLKG